MKLSELRKALELPEEEHPLGIYIGLIVGFLILGTSTFILSKELIVELNKEGIDLTRVLLTKILLMLFSAYAALACLFGFFRIVNIQRTQVKRRDAEFRDFITHAKPLVEEVIRQRIIGEKLLKELERLQISIKNKEDKLQSIGERVAGSEAPAGRGFIDKWGEFLLFVALLSSASVGLFVYLEQHPWEMVPYSTILLAFAWWLMFARYFGLIFDIRSYYVPAVFILVVPSTAIILRAFMEAYQALFVVYVLLVVYIYSMYLHFKYIVTGELPEFMKFLSKIEIEK